MAEPFTEDQVSELAVCFAVWIDPIRDELVFGVDASLRFVAALATIFSPEAMSIGRAALDEVESRA